jgi:putative chitinase
MSETAVLADLRQHLVQGLACLDVLAAPAPAPSPAPAPAPAPATPSLPPVREESAAPAFRDYGAFYDWLRGNGMLGPRISAEEYEGCDCILRAAADREHPLAWVSYELATGFWETNRTMQPVREAYWLSPSARSAYLRRMYDITGQRPHKARELGNLTPGDGEKYAGAGYPQTTGLSNFRKAQEQLGIPFVAQPSLMLIPDHAAKVMVVGMEEGWFTGRKLADTLPRIGRASFEQYKRSRPIINGTDKDDEIAAFADQWEDALLAGGWRFGS